MDVAVDIQDVENIYNQEYLDVYIKRANSETGDRLYGWRWDLVKKYCKGNLTLLDYGCASGAFHQWEENEFDVHGFDVNPYSGFNRMPKVKVGILTLWDVIEHLEHPAVVIERINPEWLFISTPNKEAVKGRLEDWKHFKPGEHLHYYNLDRLERELKELGYQVLESSFGEGEIRDPEIPENIITVVARKVV